MSQSFEDTFEDDAWYRDSRFFF